MTVITQTITTLPTAPNPSAPSTFNTLAYPFTVAIAAMGVELNTLSGQVNTVSGEVNTNATNAATSASTATSASSSATASASSATASASSASASATSAAASYDSFDDRYLGAKTSDPTLDNDGGALITGALYFNSVASEMRAYSGAAWLASYLPAGAYATLNGTETFTNKTLTAPVLTAPALGTVASGNISACTSTSMALVTPVLGTPTSGNLSNCTVDGTDAVGFRNIPINSNSAAYTAVLADSGKIIFHPSTDANARTFTIPANSSVAYALGTALTFINMTSQVVTIAITTDTMYLSSAGTTGSRSLAQYGSATAIKMTSTTWLISGSGLT